MKQILVRYFLKRWAFPFVGALFFYGGLVLANEMVTISREIFSRDGSFRYLIPLLLSALPETLGMVLPMAAVLGGLVGTQQLSEGSEMVASQGLGTGSSKILLPWFLLSCLLVLGACLNAHFLVPTACTYRESLNIKMLDEARTRFLKPGAAPWFPASNPQLCVWMDPNGEMHLIENTPETVQHLVAKSFQWSKNEQEGPHDYLKMHLENLEVALYQKTDGRVAQFTQASQDLRIEIPTISRLFPGTPLRYFPTSRLWKLKSPAAYVEISRRVSLPIASAALLLLGIGLGLGHPRFQRGGAVIKSLVVILTYYLVLKYLENQYLNGKSIMLYLLLFLPWVFLLAGWLLLKRKLRPRQPNPLLYRKLRRGLRTIKRHVRLALRTLGRRVRKRRFRLLEQTHLTDRPKVLNRWTQSLWWKNWGATLGTFLTLSLLLEYANLAGDLSKNHISLLTFLHYWILNLPPFLSVTMPLAFLMGGVLALSDATLSQEWVALRAGGTSLLQWIRAGARAWGAVLFVTLVLQAIAAPALVRKADDLYRKILNRPQRVSLSKPWMYLGSTGVVWNLDGTTRWGFPLKPTGTAPALLRWRLRDQYSEGVLWGGLAMLQGPPVDKLFPAKALQETATAEEASTPDLYYWQTWAPDPERATMLWGRLLNWLAGPCLLFAMLASTFPSPRSGRGRALGIALVVGLLYLGLQALFGGAAKAGEIPAYWGVLSPFLILLGAGLLNLHRLKT